MKFNLKYNLSLYDQFHHIRENLDQNMKRCITPMICQTIAECSDTKLDSGNEDDEQNEPVMLENNDMASRSCQIGEHDASKQPPTVIAKGTYKQIMEVAGELASLSIANNAGNKVLGLLYK